MNRNAIGVGIIALVMILAFFLRPRPVEQPVEQPAASGPPSMRVPIGLQKPAALREIPKKVREAVKAGDIPQMAPPVADPATFGAAETSAASAPGDSAWPITADGIQGAVAEALPELRACYQGWLIESPELEGRIVVTFFIEDVDGLGQITSSDVQESTTGHAAFESCVTSVVRDLAFDPPAAGAVNVNYPLVFAQEE